MNVQTGRVTTCLIAGAAVLMAVTGIGAVAPLGAQDEPEQIVIELQEVNDSGVTGTVTLTAVDGATEVMLQLEGILDGNVVHIHQGTCESYEPDPLAPSGDVVLTPTGVEGQSTTTVEIPLEEWLAEETIIHVHAGEREIEDILVCGDVVAPAMADVGGPDDAPTTGVSTNGISETGVGTAAFRSRNGLVLALGGVASLLLALGAIARRRGQASGGWHGA
ncbi:MAG: hypothetical protein ACRDJW_13655 [Thermomicrobiales bacterium]